MKKYVALQDFGEFKAGDGISVEQAGADAEGLVADGFIAEAQRPPQSETPAATDLQAAQASLAAQSDAEQRAHAGAGVLPVPSNVATLAASHGVSIDAPPAAIGIGLMQASDRESQIEFARRMEKVRPGTVGVTAGPAEDTGGIVTIDKDGVAVCPNCSRRYEAARRYIGSVLPCVCGFQLEVGAA